MKKLRWWLAGLVMVVMAVLAVGTQSVHAASGASFTIAPVLTDSQVGTEDGYFNLMLKPGQEETLAVTVTNLTGKTKRIRVTPTTAGTSNSGQLSYVPGLPTDTSAQYRLSDLMDKGTTITLQPHHASRVSFKLKVPSDGIRGQLLGAIYARDLAGYKQGGTGVTVVNKFAMVIGVMARTSDKEYAPDLKLMGVRPGVQSNQAAVIARVQNNQPRLFGSMKMVAKVTRKGQSKVLLKRTETNMSMAPNSHFDYGVYSKKALSAGTYTLTLTATAHQWHWQFKRNFTITGKQAAKVNKQTNLKPESHFPWLWVVIGVLVVIILVLLILLLKRRKDDTEKD